MLHIQVAREEKIECKFNRVDGYLFPTSDAKEDTEKLDQELAACARAGLTNVQKVRPLLEEAWSGPLLYMILDRRPCLVAATCSMMMGCCPHFNHAPAA